MNVLKLAKQIQPEVVEFRRELHAHPELSMQETETTCRVQRELDKMGIGYRKLNPTGLVAEIRGTQAESSHCVLIRADMDALNIQEETGLSFASENSGVMHACGHDTHTAMLLGAATLLNQQKHLFAGTVRLVFQPAEETGEGAKLAIAQGAADGAEMGMALHIYSDWPTGVLRARKGPAAASTDKFKITVTGKGCHGAAPNQGADPIYAGAAIVQNLQSMVSREFWPVDPIVVSVCQFHAGDRFNVIPETAVLEGTCRTFDHEIWEKIPEVMERIAQNTAAALKCEVKVEFDRVTMPLNCDARVADILKGAILKVVDHPSQFSESPIQMGGEDFAAFGDKIPIAWVQLGANGGAPMHSSKVNFDENAFPYGVACYVQFALDALHALSSR